MKKLTKKDLIEKLGRSEDEAKLYLKVQKMFPEFWEGEKISGKELWTKLNEPYGQYNKWLNKMLEAGFIENTDFLTSGQKTPIVRDGKECGYRENIEYLFTVEAAKQLCMLQKTGKSKEQGMLIRSYFILMEKIVHDYELWLLQREPQKPLNKSINKLLDERYQVLYNEITSPYVYSCNADMCNYIAFGLSAKQINEYLEHKNDGKTRDRILVDCLERLTFILEQHELLIKMGMDFNQREHMLLGMYKARYNNTQLNPISNITTELTYERPRWWDRKYMI